MADATLSLTARRQTETLLRLGPGKVTQEALSDRQEWWKGVIQEGPRSARYGLSGDAGEENCLRHGVEVIDLAWQSKSGRCRGVSAAVRQLWQHNFDPAGVDTRTKLQRLDYDRQKIVQRATTKPVVVCEGSLTIIEHSKPAPETIKMFIKNTAVAFFLHLPVVIQTPS